MGVPFARNGGSPLLRSLIPEHRISQIIWCYASKKDADRTGIFHCRPALMHHTGDGWPYLLRSIFFRAGLWGVVEAQTLDRSIRLAAQSLSDVLAREEPTHLWGVAHLELIPVLEIVSRSFRKHLHITVHDDPLHMLTKGGSRWPHKLRRRLEACYPRLLRRANSIDVVSQGMADHLLSAYGVTSLVLPSTPSFPVTIGAPPQPIEQGFKVLATGAWDCETEFAALCDGLRLAERRGLITRPRILYLNSNRRAVRTMDFDLFQFRDYVAEEEAIKLAQSCHLLYVPYRFEPRSQPLQATSFPSKVSMYLPACRPLLLHGPPGTSLARFHRETGFGLPWTSLSPEDLLPLIRKAKTQLDDLTKLYGEASLVVENYFNQAKHQQVLWSALEGTRMPSLHGV